MKFGERLANILLVFMLVLVSGYICSVRAGAGSAGWTVRSAGRRSSGGRSTGTGGAMRVDRDLYQFHYNDVDQFGDDEAYNSATRGTIDGIRYPVHREE